MVQIKQNKGTGVENPPPRSLWCDKGLSSTSLFTNVCRFSNCRTFAALPRVAVHYTFKHPFLFIGLFYRSLFTYVCRFPPIRRTYAALPRPPSMFFRSCHVCFMFVGLFSRICVRLFTHLWYLRGAPLIRRPPDFSHLFSYIGLLNRSFFIYVFLLSHICCTCAAHLDALSFVQVSFHVCMSLFTYSRVSLHISIFLSKCLSHLRGTPSTR